jgi:hypothetical protein
MGSTTYSTSGTTITIVAGLTSATSTSFIGALTGNASTVTNGVYTTDTLEQLLNTTMLAGSIANNKLATWYTISGVSLGSNLGTLTISTGSIWNFSYNGSTGVTILQLDSISSNRNWFTNFIK